MSKHAVTVDFQYESTDFYPLLASEDELEEAIESNETGEFDGGEIVNDGYLYMDALDADLDMMPY